MLFIILYAGNEADQIAQFERFKNVWHSWTSQQMLSMYQDYWEHYQKCLELTKDDPKAHAALLFAQTQDDAILNTGGVSLIMIAGVLINLERRPRLYHFILDELLKPERDMLKHIAYIEADKKCYPQMRVILADLRQKLNSHKTLSDSCDRPLKRCKLVPKNNANT